jgi:hypothetical protein
MGLTNWPRSGKRRPNRATPSFAGPCGWHRSGEADRARNRSAGRERQGDVNAICHLLGRKRGWPLSANPNWENPMVNAECSTDSQKPTVVPVLAENEVWNRTTRAGRGQAAASLCRWRRFDRATIGFWLTGATFGIGGCILGACMPYHRPAAIAISIIWWGIYMGCFGASLGALFGMFTTSDPRSGGTGAPVVPRSPDCGALGKPCHNGAAGQPPSGPVRAGLSAVQAVTVPAEQSV